MGWSARGTGRVAQTGIEKWLAGTISVVNHLSGYVQGGPRVVYMPCFSHWNHWIRHSA